ncbi:MAG TPA: hypothetical protein DCK79_05660 [Candidatus Atribacteria bacterium]|jgi:hypothetical protein|nr:hypothetical protein [Candidatus Atribacteria bacterium]
MNKQYTKIAFCPHCGNITTQRLLYTYDCEETITMDDENEGHEESFPLMYYFTACETCNFPILYAELLWGTDEKDLQKSILIWPKQKILSKKIPLKIRKYYEEAIRIKKMAPNAFAGQIRKCLEALCDDRKIKRGNLSLSKRLEKLANNGAIPKHFIEMADILRFFGNVGVHSSVKNIRSLPVDTMDDFFTAIVEYVYGFPIRIEEIKQSIKEYK